MAASRPSLMAMRLPTPAPNSSYTTISSSRSSASAGEILPAQRRDQLELAPTKLGWARLSVTVPMTSPIRMNRSLLVALNQLCGKTSGRANAAAGELRDRHLLQLEEPARLRIGHQQVGADGGGRCRDGRRVDAADRPDARQPIRQTQSGRRVTGQQHAQRVGLESPPPAGRRRRSGSRSVELRTGSPRGPARPSTCAGSKSVPEVISAQAEPPPARHGRASAYSSAIPRRSNSSRTAGVTIASRETASRRMAVQAGRQLVHRDHAGGDRERERRGGVLAAFSSGLG